MSIGGSAGTAVCEPKARSVAVLQGTLNGRAARPTKPALDPAKSHGVSAAMLHFEQAAHFGLTSSAHHVVWLQLSGRLTAKTWLAGSCLTHRPGVGSLGITPASADSAVETDGLLEGIVLHVSTECFALASAQIARHGQPLVARLNGRDDALFMLGKILATEIGQGRPNGPIFWSSAADAFIRHLVLHHSTTVPIPVRGALAPMSLRRVDEYIRANLESQLDLETLSAVCHCDRFQFVRRFQASVGMTPHRYVTRLRLDRARDLIGARTMSLAEIALQTGFYDQSHLANWVRRIYGTTPRMMAKFGELQESPRSSSRR